MKACGRFVSSAAPGLLTPALSIRFQRSPTSRLSLSCGFTSMARMARPAFLTSGRNIFSPDWNAPIRFLSIRTNGFMFPLMPDVCCFATTRPQKRRSARKKPITSRRTDTSDEEAFAFWDYGVELSRRFRALKVWMTLQYYGTAAWLKRSAKTSRSRRILVKLVSKADDFELLAPVELSICCFRYVPRDGMSERNWIKLNEQVMGLVQKGGRAYVSNATVNGRFALRACITNFRTTKSGYRGNGRGDPRRGKSLTQRRKDAK